jgi:NAD(P)-dependent dehydrogenase (short-subunit alcohol dehydrogenase family)
VYQFNGARIASRKSQYANAQVVAWRKTQLTMSLMKVAIVTGACSGIGFGTLKLLLSHGAKVASLDVTEKLPSDHPNAVHIKCDVSKHEQVEDAVATVHAKWNRIDILINCAGVLDHFGKPPSSL